MKMKKASTGIRKRYSAMKFIGEFLIIVGRVFKSFIFNILMFVFGFGCAYMFLKSNMLSGIDKSIDIKFAEQTKRDLKRINVDIRMFEQHLNKYIDDVSSDMLKPLEFKPVENR